MPKKTRKEKIQTERRIKTHAANPLMFLYTASSSTPAHKTLTASVDYRYIRSDIIKTVVLGSIFIALELLLFIYSNRLGW